MRTRGGVVAISEFVLRWKRQAGFHAESDVSPLFKVHRSGTRRGYSSATTTCGNRCPTSGHVSGYRKFQVSKGNGAFTKSMALPSSTLAFRVRQNFLKDRFRPILQGLLELVEELVCDGAVHHAMVIAQSDVTHRSNGDGVVDHNRPLFDRAEAQNADVGLADDGQAE